MGKGFIGKKRPECDKKKISETMKKLVRTPEHRKNNALAHPRGDKCWNWKGGRHIEAKGYVMLLKPEHPNSDTKGYIMEHRVVMEKHLGRYLLKNIEIVHHIDGNKQNNKIDNLLLFPSYEAHTTYHEQLKKSLC